MPKVAFEIIEHFIFIQTAWHWTKGKTFESRLVLSSVRAVSERFTTVDGSLGMTCTTTAAVSYWAKRHLFLCATVQLREYSDKCAFNLQCHLSCSLCWLLLKDFLALAMTAVASFSPSWWMAKFVQQWFVASKDQCTSYDNVYGPQGIESKLTIQFVPTLDVIVSVNL